MSKEEKIYFMIMEESVLTEQYIAYKYVRMGSKCITLFYLRWLIQQGGFKSISVGHKRVDCKFKSYNLKTSQSF